MENTGKQDVMCRNAIFTGLCKDPRTPQTRMPLINTGEDVRAPASQGTTPTPHRAQMQKLRSGLRLGQRGWQQGEALSSGQSHPRQAAVCNQHS